MTALLILLLSLVAVGTICLHRNLVKRIEVLACDFRVRERNLKDEMKHEIDSALYKLSDRGTRNPKYVTMDRFRLLEEFFDVTYSGPYSVPPHYKVHRQ